MTLSSGLFSNERNDWETPRNFFNQLNSHYHFAYDLAASKYNHKTPNYFSISDDSLKQDWTKIGGHCGLIHLMAEI